MTVGSIGLVFLVWFVSSFVIKPRPKIQTTTPQPQVLQSQATESVKLIPVKSNFVVDLSSSEISIDGIPVPNSTGTMEIDANTKALKSARLVLNTDTILEINKVISLPSPTAFNSEITSNLTMNGKIQTVVFPANVNVSDTQIQFEATLAVDPALWEITSNKKEIELQLKVVGK